MNRVALALIAVAALTGCKKADPRYCETQGDCTDSAYPYCDVNGNYDESDHVTNTCIPFPDDPGKDFCTSDSDCPAPAPICDQKVCRGCQDNSDCVGLGPAAGKNYCDTDGTCVECEPGSFIRCDGSTLVTCGSEGSGEATTACITTCSDVDGRCDDCIPGEFLRCDANDDTKVIACASDGTSETSVTCGFKCVSKYGRCFDCDSQVPDTCDGATGTHTTCDVDGLVSSEETCALGCDGDVCATCTPGDFLSCIDATTISTCATDGMSSSQMSCASGESCNPAREECSLCDPTLPATTDTYLGDACTGDPSDCCGLVGTGDYNCLSLMGGGNGFCGGNCTSDPDCNDGYTGPGTPVCAMVQTGAMACLISCQGPSDCPSGMTCSGTPGACQR